MNTDIVLQERSEILSGQVKDGGVKIVGAEYSLAAGVVDFHLDE